MSRAAHPWIVAISGRPPTMAMVRFFDNASYAS